MESMLAVSVHSLLVFFAKKKDMKCRLLPSVLFRLESTNIYEIESYYVYQTYALPNNLLI